MYLFRDQDHKELSIRCKLCFKEINFKIELVEYKSIEEFPFKREFIHGDPPHKLTAFIDKYLDVVNFEIEQLEEEVTVEKKEITNQVLREIGLTNEEIDLYFEATGRETVSLGEIAILLDKPKEECNKIVEKFLEKGLFKRIVSATPHFKALPPYAALVHQLTIFDKYISEIQKDVPPQLQESFSQLESQAEGIRKLKEYTTFMSNLKDNMLNKLTDQKERVNSIIQKIEKIKEIKGSIYSIESKKKQIINEQ
jgi:DNA-binding Lrp family transcriptional regulator